MTRVRGEGFTISLGGYGAGPDQDLEHPLGAQALRQWLLPHAASSKALFGKDGGTTDIQAKGGYTATEMAAGASLRINPRTSFYAELGKLWANGGDSRVRSGVQASIGVKAQW